jgi:hypothetical protein
MTSETILVELTEEQITRIDALAAASGVTREEELTTLLLVGLVEVETHGLPAPHPSGEEPS